MAQRDNGVRTKGSCRVAIEDNPRSREQYGAELKRRREAAA
ncbi:hypothetical protein ACI3K4_14630 [Streptomyces sp. CSMPJR101]